MKKECIIPVLYMYYAIYMLSNKDRFITSSMSLSLNKHWWYKVLDIVFVNGGSLDQHLEQDKSVHHLLPYLP